jgi:uncharacterized membrane protein
LKVFSILCSVALPLVYLVSRYSLFSESLFVGFCVAAIGVALFARSIKALFVQSLALILHLLPVVVPGTNTFLWYPCIVSLCVASLFLVSLWTSQSVCERVADKFEGPLDQFQRNYCRYLTLVWCGVVGMNAVVAGVLAYQEEVDLWGLYNGFMSYLLMGGFMVLEYLFRGYIKKRRLGLIKTNPQRTCCLERSSSVMALSGRPSQK